MGGSSGIEVRRYRSATLHAFYSVSSVNSVAKPDKETGNIAADKIWFGNNFNLFTILTIPNKHRMMPV